MVNKRRDNFPSSVVRALRERVNNFCSNPECKNSTIEPQKTNKNKINITGSAAHICAAAEGGPRYDNTMSSDERKSIENGIWLCNHCARKVDSEPLAYPVELLKLWKNTAENRVLTNSNKVFYTDIEVQKKIHIDNLKNRLSDFPTLVNRSLSGISNAINQELRQMDSRLDIRCNYVNNETHYKIYAVDKSSESVKISFKPSDNHEFYKKYNRLVEHGESFTLSIDKILSNSDALNYIFPSELREGTVCIKPTKIYMATIEITDGNENLLLELENELIIGNKYFSIFANKFNDLLSVSLKDICFFEERNNSFKFNISIDFEKWNMINILHLTYFDKILNFYEKIGNLKNFNLRILIDGYKIFSGKSNNINNEIQPILNLLRYTNSARKICEKLNINIPFQSDISFTSSEHEDIFEVSNLLNPIVKQEKFNATITFEPSSIKDLETLFKKGDFEILITQTMNVNRLKVFESVLDFNIFIKHSIKYPLVKFIEENKIDQKIFYSYQVMNRCATSLYIRETSLTPFENPKNF